MEAVIADTCKTIVSAGKATHWPAPEQDVSDQQHVMTDKLTPERRSWNMSRIRGRDTGPELIVRSLLHRSGYRFRLHQKGLPGRPDIVLRKYKSVVFVNGCFWHSHGCKDSGTPKSNTSAWQKKLDDTVMRDKKNYAQLEQAGWRVLVVWECELRDIDMLSRRLEGFLTI